MAHRSCVTQSLHVVEDLSNMFDNGDPYDIIIMVISKCYFSREHIALLYKKMV